MSDDQPLPDEFRSRIAIPNANNNFHCYQYYKKWNVAGKFNAFGRLCATRRTIALTRYLSRSGRIQFPQMAVTRNNNDEGTNSNDKS